MRQFVILIVGIAGLGILGSGCNPGTSDAARVLEADNSSLRATIAFYQSLDPTNTAVANDYNGRMATLQSDLDRSRQEVRNLTLRLNSFSQPTPGANVAVNPTAYVPPAITPGVNPGGGFASFPTFTPQPTRAIAVANPGAPISVSAPSGLSLESIVTSLGIDANGCAQNPTNVFSASAEQIYVVAVAKNYRAGTVFSTVWTGGNDFEQRYDWTAESGANELCIYFYVEPQNLQMTAGAYYVVFAASHASGSVESPRIALSLQR